MIKDRLIDEDAFPAFRVEGLLVQPEIGQNFFCQGLQLLAVRLPGEP